jgi:single-strand DNA-binding protein
MANYNKVILMGNLTRDPELRYAASGTAIASFGLAVNRRYKQDDDWKEETCFVDIAVFGRQAENCSEYLSKGSPVLIDGRLNYRKWETEDGQTRSKLDVVANIVQFLPSNRGGGKPPTETGPPQKDTAASSGDVPF